METNIYLANLENTEETIDLSRQSNVLDRINKEQYLKNIITDAEETLKIYDSTKDQLDGSDAIEVPIGTIKQVLETANLFWVRGFKFKELLYLDLQLSKAKNSFLYELQLSNVLSGINEVYNTLEVMNIEIEERLEELEREKQ